MVVWSVVSQKKSGVTNKKFSLRNKTGQKVGPFTSNDTISDNILKESESVVGFQPQHGHPTFTPKPLQKYRFKVAF